jgi:peptidoglycan/LPS O-acetylase OafA/YrhL
MVAALVVMSGHLLHIKSSSSGFLIGSHLEKILSSGSFAVTIFFGLSGVALRYQTDKFGINFRWIIARFIRLMPVYWVTLLPPIIGCYLLGVHISYPAYGFIVSTFGLQAIASGITVPPVNGPLWSLSVELYLSASLLIIGKWREISSRVILVALMFTNLILPESLIAQGLPIFYLGYLLPSLKFESVKNNTLKMVVIMIPISVLIIDPKIVQGKYLGLTNLSLCYLLASLVTTGCVIYSSANKTYLAEISQRSYSLYAVHAPILLFVDKIFFSHNRFTSASQVILSIIVIIFATEILYRFIERPSIKFSRSFLSRKNL